MIQKRLIKKTNTEVPALGFGTMRLPTKDNKIDREKATKIINHAIDEGVNYIDTAFLYHNGECEKFLKSIVEKRRDEILVSTKLPAWFVNKNEDLYTYIDKQQERLGVDVFDFYFLHSINYNIFQNLVDNCKLIEFLDDIRDKKLVKNLGFSYHGDYEGFVKILDAYDWDMCLLQYNFIDQDTQAGTRGLKYAYENDVGVIIMEPLKGGLLAHHVPDEVGKIMDEKNITVSPSRWALQWVLNHKEVSCVLSGMNEMEDLDENIQTTNDTEIDSIPEETLKVYDEVKKVYDDLIEIPCSQCGYCMPCPHGVDIPSCFKIYNNCKIFGQDTNEYFQLTSMTGGKPRYASKCKGCGVCLEKCPQHINIPVELIKVRNKFEFPLFGPIMSVAVRIGKPIYRWYLNR